MASVHVQNLFNGEPVGQPLVATIQSARDLTQYIPKDDNGHGVRLTMTRRDAAQIGAFPNSLDQWVVYTPEATCVIDVEDYD